MEQASDADCIRTVNERAFGRPNEAALVEALRRSNRFVPELSIVAARPDGVVVGHALFSVVSVEGADMLALGPVAVLPEHQKQGIGAGMIAEGLSRARELKYRAVVVVGHPEYYPRFGFKPARPIGLEAPFPVPDEVFMAMELVDGGLHGITGLVCYPPEFNDV